MLDALRRVWYGYLLARHLVQTRDLAGVAKEIGDHFDFDTIVPTRPSA